MSTYAYTLYIYLPYNIENINVHNNTFYSIISKIRTNLPLIKFKGKNK